MAASASAMYPVAPNSDTSLVATLPPQNVKHPHTGTAVSYLIRSIAKLADTSDKGTALISFL